MRQEKLEIDQQLRSIHGTNTGPMHNFQPSRRPMGSEETSSNRGGRGGQTGRGRGGRGRAPARHNSGKNYKVKCLTGLMLKGHLE